MKNDIPPAANLGQPMSKVLNTRTPQSAFGAFPMAQANRLQDVVNIISHDEWKAYDKEVRHAARKKMIARRLFGKDQTDVLGIGTTRFDFDLLTEMGDAVSSLGFQDTAQDRPAKTASTVNLIVHQLDWFMDRRKLEATLADGRRMDLAAMKGAAYKVTDAEDKCLLEGLTNDGTNYDENGLYQGAGNSEATSLDYGTKANIQTSVNNAGALLKLDSIPEPWQLVLNPTQEGQTRVSFDYSDKTYHDWIIERIGVSGEPGLIHSTPNMTAGTGILMGQPGFEFVKHVLGWDLDTWVCEVGPMKNLWAKTFIISAVGFYDNNHVCQLTTI